MIVKDGRKSYKPTYARKMTLLTIVCTITSEVKANASGNYIHRENR
jgi:hypothetical protein